MAANCGALTETLLESELFDHKKGSFTGAIEDKVGLLEAAHGGTIFLDEASETSPGLQVKLLRALQEGEVTRVGELEPRKIDVRIIAATNKDLELEIKAGRFREDLYYRLSVFPVRLPPLRDRREDIPLLAKHFLDEYAKAFRQDCPGFTAASMKALAAYDWPGNVRELANEVQRALVLATPGKRLDLTEVSEKITGTPPGTTEWKKHSALRDAIEAVERELIQRAHETFPRKQNSHVGAARNQPLDPAAEDARLRHRRRKRRFCSEWLNLSLCRDHCGSTTKWRRPRMRYIEKSWRSVVKTRFVANSSASTTSVESAKSIGRSSYFSMSSRDRRSEASVDGTRTAPPARKKSIQVFRPLGMRPSRWVASVNTASLATTGPVQLSKKRTKSECCFWLLSSRDTSAPVSRRSSPAILE